MLNDSDPRCFAPNRINCGGTVSPNSELELYRWYYSTVNQACEPIHVPRGQKTFCSAMTELPTTKRECEDLCGKNIVIVNNFGQFNFIIFNVFFFLIFLINKRLFFVNLQIIWFHLILHF